MDCLKEEKRTLFDLFKVYDCNNCMNKNEDEIFIIGNRVIAIYYLFTCKKNKKDSIYIDSLKLQLLLLEAIKYDNDIVLLWLEDVKYLDRYFNIFQAILDDGLDIQIIAF